MDKQFKHRLTGAVILVVAFVVLAPAMLKGPHAPDEEASVAGGEGPPVRSYTIDLSEVARDPRGSDMSTGESLQPEMPAQPLDESLTDEAQADAKAEATTKAEAATKAAPSPSSKSATKASSSSTPRELAAPVTSRPVSPSAAASTVVASGFAVQLGSFGDRANADRLVAELKRQGFPAFVSPISKPKKLYRVRVGPVADRAAAQAMATRLATFKRSGKVVPHP